MRRCGWCHKRVWWWQRRVANVWYYEHAVCQDQRWERFLAGTDLRWLRDNNGQLFYEAMLTAPSPYYERFRELDDERFAWPPLERVTNGSP